MAQKNLHTKFNFYRDLAKKSILFEQKNHSKSQRAYQPPSTERLKGDHKHHKFSWEIHTKKTSVLKDNLNTSAIHHHPKSADSCYSVLNRRKSVSQKVEPNTFVKKQKTLSPLVQPLQDCPPKLRQTNSTLCTSPKVTVSKIKPRISEFKKLKILGKGRFGHVYLVKNITTGFLFALKIIKKEDLQSGGSQQENQKAKMQLIRQITIQWNLQHPNLIKLYDFFSDQINIYLVLELACDGHLFDLLARKKTLSQESTSIIVREIAEGVNYMHRRETIHRDIKLENIVLSHGMAKICDFGWSVHCPKEFRSTICGTPLYLSPQILLGLHYNKKIDSWALGALTHELLTGDNPFQITTRQELSKIVTEDVEIEKGSPELRSFITFILRKNPGKRPDIGTILLHPFIEKYKDLETSQELCQGM